MSLTSIGEAFDLARLGNQTGAAEMLRHEFEKLQSPSRRIDLCEWIADCFERLEDYGQAGTWYETAGELILAQAGVSFPAAILTAVGEYERALACYGRGDEEEGVERCELTIATLKSHFASS